LGGCFIGALYRDKVPHLNYCIGLPPLLASPSNKGINKGIAGIWTKNLCFKTGNLLGYNLTLTRNRSVSQGGTSLFRFQGWDSTSSTIAVLSTSRVFHLHWKIKTAEF
jgi:hypothetical protein